MSAGGRITEIRTLTIEHLRRRKRSGIRAQIARHRGVSVAVVARLCVVGGCVCGHGRESGLNGWEEEAGGDTH